MVIGFLKVETTRKVYDNIFYGHYEVKDVYTETITNEEYNNLVNPKNGLIVTIKDKDAKEETTFTFSKYFYTGEYENQVDEDTEFSTTFAYKGHVYEIKVDYCGQLISLDMWINTGDYEDGTEPDEHYTKKSKGVKWTLMEL